jgi:peptide-methionine (S)-S-oxide reductase
VINTTVGYTGGHVKNPKYEQVCSGTTGHAEAIEIEFDPKIISYKDLLDIFWNHHNPTTYNRQGPDVGEQYRAAIFFHNDKQKKLALESLDNLIESKKYKEPIVTEVTEATEFYPAEEYHQDYADKNPHYVCHI